MGANKHHRVKRVVGACLFLEFAVTLVYSLVTQIFGKYLCLLYTSDAVVIEWSLKAMQVTSGLYTIVSIMYAFQCGLKGMSVGGAQVSTKHSGFVVNTGGATCGDVLELTEKVSRIVKEKTGFELELEGGFELGAT